MKHGLIGIELRYWGQYATGIAGEEDDIGRVVVGDAGDLGIFDVLDGVSAASVLREGGVVVVDDAGDGVKDDVLKDGAELDGVVDVWLFFGGEANAFGVAATLDIEDAAVRPAMLVVADEGALRVGREGGLARAGEAEEDSDVVVLADVCG